ncbi:unnamed protein product [Bursaphelenchus xylophilus]|uniref:(pine wood nematode) hypothetical protein n=1 Tax=Bursaphelenchus xylophilus TaxID=6326 RepID=A0A1I7RT06_BURXY|nr:unnamed protein product [Bursaphelenchus xylophilus]CAG9122698.1 unnamed protein product [Bursaphelenchus xylophilus]
MLLALSFIYGIIQSQFFKYTVHLVNLMIDTANPRRNIQFLGEGMRLCAILLALSFISMIYIILFVRIRSHGSRKDTLMLRILQNLGAYVSAVFLISCYYNWKIAMTSFPSYPITVILRVLKMVIEKKYERTSIVVAILIIISQNFFNGLAIFISTKQWKGGYSTPSEVFLILTSMFWVNSKVEAMASDVYNLCTIKKRKAPRSPFFLSFRRKLIYSTLRFLSIFEFYFLWYLWVHLLALFEDKPSESAVAQVKLQRTLFALALCSAGRILLYSIPNIFLIYWRKSGSKRNHRAEKIRFIEEKTDRTKDDKDYCSKTRDC